MIAILSELRRRREQVGGWSHDTSIHRPHTKPTAAYSSLFTLRPSFKNCVDRLRLEISLNHVKGVTHQTLSLTLSSPSVSVQVRWKLSAQQHRMLRPRDRLLGGRDLYGDTAVRRRRLRPTREVIWRRSMSWTSTARCWNGGRRLPERRELTPPA